MNIKYGIVILLNIFYFCKTDFSTFINSQTVTLEAADIYTCIYKNYDSIDFLELV